MTVITRIVSKCHLLALNFQRIDNEDVMEYSQFDPLCSLS